MITVLVFVMLGLTLLCSLILVAAMVVASRSNARSTESLAHLRRISHYQPDDLEVGERPVAVTEIASHRNLAQDLHAVRSLEHERKAEAPPRKPVEVPADSDFLEQVENSTADRHL